MNQNSEKFYKSHIALLQERLKRVQINVLKSSAVILASLLLLKMLAETKNLGLIENLLYVVTLFGMVSNAIFLVIFIGFQIYFTLSLRSLKLSYQRWKDSNNK